MCILHRSQPGVLARLILKAGIHWHGLHIGKENKSRERRVIQHGCIWVYCMCGFLSINKVMKAMSTILFQVMLHMQHTHYLNRVIKPNVQLKMGANVNVTYS